MKPNFSIRKRERKTSLFLKEISSLIQTLSMDEPLLQKVFVTKVELSKDYKLSFIYFSTYGDKKQYEEALEVLKLYKPSLRKAMTDRISGKYVPDLVFVYDKNKEKERRINKLLDEVSKELSGKE